MPIHLTTRINPQKWIYKIKKFVGDGGRIVRRVTQVNTGKQSKYLYGNAGKIKKGKLK